jgi:hypothetical protein
MKRLFFIPFIILCMSAFAFAQDFDNPQIFIELGLTNEELSMVMEIHDEARKQIREAQIELNLYKAQLEKLLFPPEINMKEVERILKESLEWKLKSELAEIRRRVEIRKVLGEARWEKLLRILASRRHKRGFPPEPPGQEPQLRP